MTVKEHQPKLREVTMESSTWTWGQALTVFAVGFSGVFICLLILQIGVNLYSFCSRLIVSHLEKKKIKNS